MMKLVKKIMSFGLIFSILFGVCCVRAYENTTSEKVNYIYANEDKNEEKINKVFCAKMQKDSRCLDKSKKSKKTALTTKQKVFGGISVLGGLSFLGYLAYRHWSFDPFGPVPYSESRLPVLVIGGTQTDRAHLIEKIYSNVDLASSLKNRLLEGGNYFNPFDENLADCRNWVVRNCSIDDAQAMDLAERSPVIIAVVDSRESATRLHHMFEHVHSRYYRAIMTVVKDRAVNDASELNAPVHGGQEVTNSLLVSELVAFWDTANGTFTNDRRSTGLRTMVNGLKSQRRTEREISDYLDGIYANNERLNERWNNWIDTNGLSSLIDFFLESSNTVLI